MRKSIGSALLLAVLLPSVGAAQRRAAAAPGKQELGVDVGLAYAKPDGVDGGIQIGTPLDIRLGLRSKTKVMWEPRVTFAFSTVGGETRYGIAPGVNVLYATAPGGHRQGMYVTGGGALNLLDTGADAGTAFAFNAGVGWRRPWGSGAWRYEAGFRYSFENQDIGLPSTIEIGVRFGVSLWH
jgi:hypothetical protein